MKAVLLGTQPKPPMASLHSTSSVLVSPAGAGPPKLRDLVKNNASTTTSLTSPNTFGVLEQDPQGPDSLMLPPASLSSMNPTGTATTTISTASFSQEQKGAAMLLSFAAIVTKEIDSPEGVNWEDADDQGRHQHLLQHHSRLHSKQSSLPSLSPTKVPSLQEFLRKKRASSALRIRAFDSIQDGPANTSGRSDWSRIRAVSIDDVEEHSPASEEEQDADISDDHDDDHAGISVGGKMTLGPKRNKASRIVSPMSSPVTRKLPVRKSTLRNIGRKRRKTPKLPPIGPIKNGSSSNITGNRRKANANTSNNSNNNTSSNSNATTSGTSKGRQSSKRRVLQPNAPPKTESVKTILRKKFSWKNYPEVRARVPTLDYDRDIHIYRRAERKRVV